MTEFELLEELLKTETEIESLEWKIKYIANKEENESEEHLIKLKNKKERLENDLINIEDKSKSKDAFNTIRAQIVEYIRNFESINKSYRLDRNQATMTENYLFIMILQDICYIATNEHNTWIHVRENILYNTDENSSVETAIVVGFLKNELIILRQLENINYIELKKYYKDLTRRIEDKFYEQPK